MASNNKYWMNDEEFKLKLSLVAEWRIPDTVTGTKDGIAKKKRGRKSEEEKFQAAHEEIFNEIHGGKNPYFPPIIDKVKCIPVTCEDCGKHCENGRHKEKKQYETNHRHWRERCVTCNLFKHPETGEYSVTVTEASNLWSKWLRKVNPRYVKKDYEGDSEVITSDPSKFHKI